MAQTIIFNRDPGVGLDYTSEHGDVNLSATLGELEFKSGSNFFNIKITDQAKAAIYAATTGYPSKLKLTSYGGEIRAEAIEPASQSVRPVQSGGGAPKRRAGVLRTGPNGGKYYVRNGRKVYVK